jgi:hypothetical protein
MKAKYGIADEDIQNFDESGFLIGKISSQLVVTAWRSRVGYPGTRRRCDGAHYPTLPHLCRQGPYLHLVR